MSNASRSWLEPDNTSAPVVFGKPLDKVSIVYLTCPPDASRSFLGGLLLTDTRTRPLEFSYVPPVKIGLMQRLVHGKMINDVVLVDVIAKRLLEECTRVPDIIMVNAHDLLAVQRLTRVPVALLEKPEPAGNGGGIIPGMRFDCALESARDAVAHFFNTVAPTVDLYDPFDRLKEAITEALKNPDAVGPQK